MALCVCVCVCACVCCLVIVAVVGRTRHDKYFRLFWLCCRTVEASRVKHVFTVALQANIKRETLFNTDHVTNKNECQCCGNIVVFTSAATGASNYAPSQGHLLKGTSVLTLLLTGCLCLTEIFMSFVSLRPQSHWDSPRQEGQFKNTPQRCVRQNSGAKLRVWM